MFPGLRAQEIRFPGRAEDKGTSRPAAEEDEVGEVCFKGRSGGGGGRRGGGFAEEATVGEDGEDGVDDCVGGGEVEVAGVVLMEVFHDLAHTVVWDSRNMYTPFSRGLGLKGQIEVHLR